MTSASIRFVSEKYLCARAGVNRLRAACPPSSRECKSLTIRSAHAVLLAEDPHV